MTTKCFSLFCCAFLCACAAGKNYDAYLQKKGIYNISVTEFDHCHGYGCRLVDIVSLTEADWQDVEMQFSENDSAHKERRNISAAIALLEQRVGAVTGTQNDKGGTFSHWDNDQLDCVDESVNTTVYLALLKEKNLLRLHDIASPTARYPIFSGHFWPHQTAVIREIETDNHYAVDSWFHDNGKPSEIVPLKDWYEGWNP